MMSHEPVFGVFVDFHLVKNQSLFSFRNEIRNVIDGGWNAFDTSVIQADGHRKT
jgi:hypothetical protein